MPDRSGPAAPDLSIRIDKWLWHARFFKSRSLAAGAVSAGGMTVNGQPVSRPSRLIVPGDRIAFDQAGWPRVVQVRAPGARRGPAPEAQALYDDQSPPLPPRDPPAPGADAAGRPTKRDRRALDRFRAGDAFDE